VLSYRDELDDRMAKASLADVLQVSLCVGMADRVCIASFWKAGSRQWCVDGAGIVSVLPADLFRRHLCLLYAVRSTEQHAF
jgi:hypothetical protein